MVSVPFSLNYNYYMVESQFDGKYKIERIHQKIIQKKYILFKMIHIIKLK